ncbi:hypothetical protein [Nitrosopumilus piranensis]|uniref:Uncharacterized protein n=1 Tax=Nitrosopumilus piranensis TaxID=1582439 RepID=A0A0C5BNL5_9ARCH|nr:hypothetical protein [Nitrosopumilus piranensis]AJM91303.1 conserved exported protein of unknown function [Nitrosopumilus piranensis]
MNKIIFFSVVFLFLPIASSYGTFSTELGDNIFILAQTTVRNSDGTLIVYLESSKFSDLNKNRLNSFLNYEASLGTDPIITIDEQKFQVIRRVQFETFTTEGLVSSTSLFDTYSSKNIHLARFAHDGYYVESGDTMKSIWTFVRPVS